MRTGPVAPSAAPPGTPAELAAALAALRSQIAADQAGWEQRLVQLAAAVARLDEPGAGTPPAEDWLTLLDEAEALTHGLERQRTMLAERLQGLLARRRAEAAYQRRGQRP